MSDENDELPRISAIKVNSAEQSIRISWTDGKKSTLRPGHHIKQRDFAPFGDPTFLEMVKVARGGRTLEWPGELILDAEAIYPKVRPPRGSRSFAARIPSYDF